MTRPFHSDDGGFSTVGMVVALLLTLSLLFTSAQAYRIHSLSADVQSVADASALAAENQVASFYVVSQVCDSVVLTMSLTGIATAGVGAVALCVPGGAGVGEKLLEASLKIIRARNSFAEKATDGLNKLQKFLPFFAAAQAMGVAQANSSQADYFALAVLLPVEGEEIAIEEMDGSSAVEELQSKQGEIEQAAREAEEAAARANEHKQRAFMADCGADPGYCMEERARSLAGLSGVQNPHYSSAATWSFSVALKRAQEYYPRRLAQEAPENNSIAERSNSALRTRIYTYAVSHIGEGYVLEGSDGSFSASFPLIPCNTAEVRETELYTEQIYPVTESDGAPIMHAWSGCPEVSSNGSAWMGSIADLEAGGFQECPYCHFTTSSLGSVAAASTSIDNGFEHYYRIVAEEAQNYSQAKAIQAPAEQRVKQPVNKALDQFLQAAKQAAGARIHINPPGRSGAIVICTDTSSLPVSDFFSNGFVQTSGALGPRAALAAAALGEDDPEESEDVITSLFDGFLADSSGIAAHSLPLVLDLWSALLKTHARGVTALEEGVEAALNTLPLIGYSGLGSWARGKLEDMVASVGLEPADLISYKPYLVNTYRVASQDDSAFSQAILGGKDVASHLPASSTMPGSAAIYTVASYAKEKIDDFDGEFEIASIELLGEGGPSIPLTITLPSSVKNESGNLIDRARDAVLSISGSEGMHAWE